MTAFRPCKPNQPNAQVLQDEVHALQLELLSVMEKLQRIESEYEVLLERWLKKKNEEAQKVNEANAIYESYVCSLSVSLAHRASHFGPCSIEHLTHWASLCVAVFTAGR